MPDVKASPIAVALAADKQAVLDTLVTKHNAEAKAEEPVVDAAVLAAQLLSAALEQARLTAIYEESAHIMQAFRDGDDERRAAMSLAAGR